ncbi:MAG: Gfo/Idh/MocA family oxidoreductase [Candidatus Bathyarchaeota archaeon]|nr:Gfo/Idh/MocA family oxidoreductase [Candidatus Bathyarchaeota archaeon]
MSGVLNFGVIGVGVIGRSHLQAIMSQKNARALAIADINEKTLKSVAEDFKIEKFFVDYHDLLALKDIDAVIVATPPFNHSEITCDAAAAGKHVLCEKPMAMNSKEAVRMVESCKKAGVKLGICSARSRLTPQSDLAKQYISGGKLGNVYYARFTTIRRRGRPGIDILKESKWFLDSSKAGGGALIDIGCYDIDLALYLLGDLQPLSVSAMTFRGINSGLKLEAKYDVEEHSVVFVRFKDGLKISFETAWAANINPYQETIIFGSKGGLRLNPFTYFSEEDGKGVAISYDLSIDWSKIQNLLIEDFVRACLEDKPPKTPGEDGLKVMQIIDMAYKSAKLGKEVKL